MKQSCQYTLALLKHVTVGVPIFVALALGSASVGYFLGRGAVLSATPAAADESGAEADDGGLGRIQPEPTDECKLVRTPHLGTAHRNCLTSKFYPMKVLVVRSDLDMTTGKVAAQ